MPTALVTPDQDSIIAEIEIAAPPERVFRALTQRDQLMRWWTTDVCELELWEFDARLGGKWRFVTKESSLAINGVSKFAAEGEVLEFDPPRLACLYLDCQLARRSHAPYGRPLGIEPYPERHRGQGDPQRSRTGRCSPQGLHRRLDRRTRAAQKARRKIKDTYGNSDHHCRSRRSCCRGLQRYRSRDESRLRPPVIRCIWLSLYEVVHEIGIRKQHPSFTTVDISDWHLRRYSLPVSVQSM